MTHDTRLLLVTLAGVVGLVTLVAGFRLHAFLALALASLGVGLAAGMAPLEVAKAFQDGVGSTLGLIAVVVGLGTMLGKLLAESGGAGVIANTFVDTFGERRLDTALLIAAFLVGMPVFFGVGLVLLVPVVFTLGNATKIPFLRLALPLLAGLAVCHTLVPPHPGPVVAVGRLNADMGRTLFWSILVGFPTALFVGPVLARGLARRLTLAPGGLGALFKPSQAPTHPPGFAVSLGTILLPVALMVAATAADVGLPRDHPARPWVAFAGSPLIAMLAAVLVALVTFGSRRGFSTAQTLRFLEDCLGPVAGIFLIVGAGGGFSKVLDLAGVDDAIAAWGRELALSPLVLGWLVAVLLRIAVGSATVAITMASAILAPIADARPEVSRELLVVSMAAGSIILSHVNDGGFWLVKEYFGLSVPETLRTWTLMVTLASGMALVLVLIADQLLRLA
ncbi:MAG: gluconate:H+ symporter [Limisphaerales bacterium]